MIRLVQGEVRKLFTTLLWLWMLLGSFALTAIFMSVTLGLDGAEGNPNPPLATDVGQRNLFGIAGAASVFVLILGIIAITGEFRHQTVTPTFLNTPHRGRVVISKLVTYVLVGLGYGIAVVLLAIAIALPWLSAKDIDVSLTGNGIPGTLVGVIAGLGLYALLGVGVGALIRNQIAAVVGAVVYLVIVEGC